MRQRAVLVYLAATNRLKPSSFSGISPLYGARALTRILLASTPLAVVAVSEPIENLDSRNVTPSSQVIAAAATPNVAPKSKELEGTLTVWWQEMLGVEEVGLDDRLFCSRRSFPSWGSSVCQDKKDLSSRPRTCCPV